MAGYYYLISSLPMLMFDGEAPMTVEEFVSNCHDHISKRDSELLEKLSLIPEIDQTFPAGSAADRWKQWEICLRNRIAVHRAPQGKDVHGYLRDESGCFCEIDSGIQEAFAIKNPLDREKYFDRMRWRALDDFESGHHFDFDRLCVYKLKLMLLEKWSNRQVPEGVKNLESMLEKIDSDFNADNNNEENTI
jgi:hypothetical protein